MHLTRGLPSRLDEAELKSVFPSDTALVKTERETLKLNTANSLPDLKHWQGDDPIDLVLWGDSHAGNFIPLLFQASRTLGIKTAKAYTPGIPPLLKLDQRPGKHSWSEANAKVLQLIKEKDARSVLLIARWDHYLDRRTLVFENSRITSASDAFQLSVESTLHELQRAEVQVFIVCPIPPQRTHIPRALFVIERFGLFEKEALSRDASDALAEIHSARKILCEAASLHANCKIIDFTQSLIRNDRLLALDQGFTVYKDDNHLSLYGTSLCFHELASALVPISELPQENGNVAKRRLLKEMFLSRQPIVIESDPTKNFLWREHAS
ncbi:MAG: hypothetical protein NXI32_24605 [bacterium]|nr:hypothetical protein [bacterium]